MSHEMDHFSMGLWALGLAYTISVVGSLVGLACAQQSATATSRSLRWRWNACAALTIGGVAVWLMHFIGMMGFDVHGSSVKYDLSKTILSVVLSVGATAFGLALVGPAAADRRGRGSRLLVAGLVMGAAVSAMHYTGMWALNIQGSIDHAPGPVIASIAIGVVAATAALWFSQVANRWYLQVPAALVMGLAVVALHYTGMSGVRVHVDPAAPEPTGLSVTALLFPAFGVGILVLAAVTVSLMVAPTQEDRERETQIAKWEQSARV